MARQFMIGTLDDTPLLMLNLDGEKYLVDLIKKQVFSDTAGMPSVTDAEIVTKVLSIADAKK